MRSRLEQFTGGQDLAVDIAGIEKELTSLWKSARQTSGEESTTVATRACLWNLVVHSSGTDTTQRLREELEGIYPSTPMRTLVMEIEPDLDPVLSAWVSARCHLTGRGQFVCSEEVTIRCDARATDRLGPLINALQVPDVPSAVWWPDLRSDPRTMCAHFVDRVDRIIVDTSTTDGAKGLALLTELPNLRHAERALFGDLSWHRIAPWRALCAQLFDAAVGALRDIDSVHIGASACQGEGPGSQALLFGGWLASRLGWKPRSAGWTSADKQIDLKTIQTQDQGHPGDLRSVIITTSDGETYRLERTDDGLLHARAPHLGAGDRAFLRLRPFSSAEYLQRELGPLGDDPVMWESIDAISL